MLSKLVSLGDRLELTAPAKMQQNKEDNEPQPHKKTYVSQVYDVLEDEQLKIAMPIVEGRVIPLPLHGRYDVTFFTAGGLYQAKSVIVERYKEDGLFILVIELTSELKKYQRRQYFRLEYTMDVEYVELTKEEVISVLTDADTMDNMLEGDMKAGTILDISGGGLRFTTPKQMKPNTCILVKINIGLTQPEEYGIVGYVISSTESEKKEKVYINRIEFKNLKNATREKLIKFIFETERRIRKKG